MKISKFLSYIILFSLLSTQYSFGQNLDDFSTRNTIKIEIVNYFQTPPGCGFMKTASFYVAKVKGFDKYIYGDSILIFVICRAERDFKELIGKNYSADLKKSYFPDDCAISNFTDFSFEELKKKRSYELITLEVLDK